jgi:hypothetical protein
MGVGGFSDGARRGKMGRIIHGAELGFFFMLLGGLAAVIVCTI